MIIPITNRIWCEMDALGNDIYLGLGSLDWFVDDNDFENEFNIPEMSVKLTLEQATEIADKLKELVKVLEEKKRD